MDPYVIAMLAIAATGLTLMVIGTLLASMSPERIDDGQESNEDHEEGFFKFPEADATDGYYRRPTEDANPTGTVHN